MMSAACSRQITSNVVRPWLVSALVAALSLVAHSSVSGQQADESVENWPGFRGPSSNGHVLAATPPTQWSVEASKNIRWKTPLTKHGMSSPVVWKDRVFLTGADDESRDIDCFDAETGNRVWSHSVDKLPDAPLDGALPIVLQETGFAAPTVATNGQVVAAVFATGELVGVSMKGERVWTRHLGIPDNHYGHASSLICNRELLFVQYDQKDDAKLLAFEMATGKPVWQVARQEMSWASPILIENHGRMELVLVDNKYVCSYSPKTGERHWQIECLDGEIAPSAAYAAGTIYVTVEGCTAVALDISDHSADPKLLWQWDGDLPDASSPVATDEFLIVPTAFGLLTCLNAKSGEVHWEHEFDRGFCSSPIVAKDRVYIADLSGRTQVFKLASEFELLAESSVGESIFATPAFVGNRIFLRGLTHLFCIGERGE